MNTNQPRRAATPALSKTRFIAGLQCHLRLWNDVHRRDLATPWADTQQAIFDRGTRIGELAQRRYPGGELVGFKPWERAPAIEATRRLMADESVPAIYEAAIEHQGVYARVDVLVRSGDAWDLVEVKASTRPEKDVFRQDVAVQHWIARGAGLSIASAGVLVLNREYLYPGGEYDLQQLFAFGDATEFCTEAMPAIEANVGEFQRMLSQDQPPDITVGDHCFSPYECPYYAHCSAGLPQPDYPVDSLHRLRAPQREELDRRGIEEIAEIPEDFALNGLQSRMRRAVIDGRPWISDQLGQALGDARRPLYFLDFEAFQPALPQYPGTRPFEAIPFLYSVHRQHPDGTLTHRDYLHRDKTDPRPAIARKLIDDLGKSGSIVVYSDYERRMLNDLVRACPQHADALQNLIDRLWDLLPVVRNHYYHPELHGSFSIKVVLPVLDPQSGWSELDIADGMAAAIAYEGAVSSSEKEQQATVFENLKAYCAQDTLAMVRLYAALVDIVKHFVSIKQNE